MPAEHAVIELISREIPSGPGRLSTTFTHDAELCAFPGGNLLFTTDEFSGEDHFPVANPFCLGWNITAGAISDIIATGGTPLYYAHALTVDSRWDEPYLRQFCRGVRTVLQHYGTCFIGGDIGTASTFRCTASVIGRPSSRPLCRKGAAPGDLLYLSGKIGAGNFNAALSLFGDSSLRTRLATRGTMRFSLLDICGPVVARYASACIDSSDGVFVAADTLADVNNVGYRIGTLPCITRGKAAARLLHLPETMLFFGECGEYELLFTVHPADEEALLDDLRSHRCSAYRIGEVVEPPSVRNIRDGKIRIDCRGPVPRGRDFSETGEYLKALHTWIQTRQNG